MGRKLTNIEFIDKAVKIHGDKSSLNVLFADKYGNDVPDSYITTSIISDILNEYELLKIF